MIHSKKKHDELKNELAIRTNEKTLETNNQISSNSAMTFAVSDSRTFSNT
jgi:hypothetical protein